ncbi:hypothetical protein MHBO_000613 [Bonamia ostreae]|uniref:Uncharacterized protein n=1 Tax=Bonamia ostreae TaxID=126728 RepID=A0ABV2AG99_9EUKA
MCKKDSLYLIHSEEETFRKFLHTATNDSEKEFFPLLKDFVFGSIDSNQSIFIKGKLLQMANNPFLLLSNLVDIKNKWHMTNVLKEKDEIFKQANYFVAKQIVENTSFKQSSFDLWSKLNEILKMNAYRKLISALSEVSEVYDKYKNRHYEITLTTQKVVTLGIDVVCFIDKMAETHLSKLEKSDPLEKDPRYLLDIILDGYRRCNGNLKAFDFNEAKQIEREFSLAKRCGSRCSLNDDKINEGLFSLIGLLKTIYKDTLHKNSNNTYFQLPSSECARRKHTFVNLIKDKFIAFTGEYFWLSFYTVSFLLFLSIGLKNSYSRNAELSMIMLLGLIFGLSIGSEVAMRINLIVRVAKHVGKCLGFTRKGKTKNDQEAYY